MTARRQIFAIGGNFKVDPWEEPALQRHFLSLTGKSEPSICYMGTAGGDNPFETERFYRDMARHRCRISHLNMFAPSTNDFTGFFQGFDAIYVGGGATRNLVSIWKDWGVDLALCAAYEAGVVLGGTSAGAICWFEGSITDSLPATLLPLACTGILPGSCSTHYGYRPDRRPTFQARILDGSIPGPGIAIDDHAAVHYVDGSIHEVVVQQSGANAYLVERHEGRIRETPLPKRFIG